MRTVTLVEAPTSAGGYAPGQEDGPRALLEAGLVERLEAAGVAVHPGGQVTPVDGGRTSTTPGQRTPVRSSTAPARLRLWSDLLQPKTRFWSSEATARLVSAPWPAVSIVLSGWVSSTPIGTLTSTSPDSTVDDGLDWMGVAHMLDIDGAVDGLAALAGHRPVLSPGQISFLRLGPHTHFEAEVITDRNLPVVDVERTASDPRGSARAALSPLAACDALAVHFDVDLVDFLDAPLAENTDRGTAPSLAASARC
jgi:arginase